MSKFRTGVLFGEEVDQVYADAKVNGYALPAVNVVSTSTINAVMETAAKLGQQLFEIQNSTITELTNMQQKNLENYLEMTRAFTTKLPEATDPQKMVELQQEMAQTLWQSYQQSNESTGELVRNAWDQVGEAYRDAFTPEDK